MTGSFLGLDGDSARVRAGQNELRIAVAAVDSLWIRRSHAWTGAKWGFAAAGALGLVGWFSFCGGVTEGGGCHTSDYDNVVLLSAVTAIPGGLIGAAIGAGTHTWQMLHPVPPAEAR